MGDQLPHFTAAAVQAAPVFLDREGTIQKACELIAEAGHAGARLIVFPETWIPTYPWWHVTQGVFSNNEYLDLWKNAVEVPSESTAQLCDAAMRAGAYVVIGINERDTVTRGTLFNTIIYLAPSGEIAHRHRKLMPTFTERTIWGFGDGSDLDVVDTPLGRVGGLICWEHEMTLAKYALYAQGEQVHCAVWPAFTTQNEHIDFGMRQYAYEGASFVVSACGVITPGSLPESLASTTKANGGSAIVGPDGKYLAGPLYDREEIIYAEVDLEAVVREKHSRDVAGHYARPDVFQLIVNRARKPVATFVGPDPLRADPLRADVPYVATPETIVDRLETVRAYLGSLIDRIEHQGDAEVSAAIEEALASLEIAATGVS
ncbi:MAG: carbon-nitrogen hydrolase family protein [Dehalococcoidia bacterium]